MKNRKIKNYLKIGILLFGFAFLLENCENNNEENIHLEFENSENLNLKTVSFQDAKNFFNVKIEELKEERKGYLRKGNETPLELTPDWNSIDHDELYGIKQAQLTLADVNVNRDGDYISKLFFINRNGKMESIIFTIYQEEVDNDGRIIQARMYFNELNGKFIDGYKIEDGKITKRLVVKKGVNVQKAAFFMFFEEKVDCWNIDTLGDFEGGLLDEVFFTAPGGGGGSSAPYFGPNYYTGGISAATSGSNSGNYSGGGASYNSVTGLAGSLYASNVRELAEGEEEETYACYCNCEGTETEFTNKLANNMEPKWGQLANKQEILDEINSIPNLSNMTFDEQIKALENHFNRNLMYGINQNNEPYIININNDVEKYIYTEIAGWLDFHHIFKLFKWAKEKGPTNALLGGEIGELVQSLKGNYSAYSYEDLPSNNVGVALFIRFGKQLEEGTISWANAIDIALE